LHNIALYLELATQIFSFNTHLIRRSLTQNLQLKILHFTPTSIRWSSTQNLQLKIFYTHLDLMVLYQEIATQFFCILHPPQSDGALPRNCNSVFLHITPTLISSIEAPKNTPWTTQGAQPHYICMSDWLGGDTKVGFLILNMHHCAFVSWFLLQPEKTQKHKSVHRDSFQVSTVRWHASLRVSHMCLLLPQILLHGLLLRNVGLLLLLLLLVQWWIHSHCWSCNHHSWAHHGWRTHGLLVLWQNWSNGSTHSSTLCQTWTLLWHIIHTLITHRATTNRHHDAGATMLHHALKSNIFLVDEFVSRHNVHQEIKDVSSGNGSCNVILLQCAPLVLFSVDPWAQRELQDEHLTCLGKQYWCLCRYHSHILICLHYLLDPCKWQLMILEVIHLPSSKNYSTHVRDSYTDYCTPDSYIYSYAYAYEDSYKDSALHQASPKATTISWTFHRKAAVVQEINKRTTIHDVQQWGLVCVYLLLRLLLLLHLVLPLWVLRGRRRRRRRKNWSKICEVAED